MNVKRKVPPTATVPLSNVCPSSLVTVWGAKDMFFQITVVPTLIVNVAELKPKLPLLSLLINNVCVEPVTGVGVIGATVVVGAELLATAVGI